MKVNVRVPDAGRAPPLEEFSKLGVTVIAAESGTDLTAVLSFPQATLRRIAPEKRGV